MKLQKWELIPQNMDMNPVNKAATSVEKLFGGKTTERRIQKADQWFDFVVKIGDIVIGLALRGYEKFQ